MSDDLPHEPQPVDQELDGLRIRKLAMARRAALRLSSYALIAALVCGVGAVDLLWRAARRLGAGEWSRPALYILAAAALAWAGLWQMRRARRLNHEARRETLAEPVQPPDFSTLSDGSQIARHLENIE